VARNKVGRRLATGQSLDYLIRYHLSEIWTLDITKDIQPMTTFRNHSADIMRHLKETKRPVILTVNGKAAAVVQDAEAYQRLLDLAAKADAAEGIRQGLEDMQAGRSRPAAEVFEEFRTLHRIPR
jgi:prevent-host-death family protein